MSKFIFILFLAIAFFQICYGSEDKNQIKFINGVAIQNGKALYIDPDKMEGVSLIAISEASIKNSKANILKDSILVPLEGNVIYVYDSKRKDPYFELYETERKYFYKIEDNKMFISKDRNTWKNVNVKIVSINDEKKSKDSEGPVFMTIYLESEYFKGEYDLIGTPDSEPFD